MSKQSAFAVILTFAAAIAFAVDGLSIIKDGNVLDITITFAIAAFLAFLTVKGSMKLIAIRKSLNSL
jgi:hypothetical protein